MSNSKIRVLVVLAGLFGITFAQSIRTNPVSIKFDTTLTASKDSSALWIVNATAMHIKITDINIYSDVFSVKDTSYSINPNDSVKTWIYFSSIHNLTYTDFAFVETNLTSGSIVVPLSGTKKFAEPLYLSTQGKSGEPLKTALNAITKVGYTSLGYNVARDRMYGNIDNVGGDVECVYTGRIATFNTRSGATSNNFNCEHTWPQSKFAEANPMVSDINHLFSTDEAANGKRSNFPFGVVVTSSWSVGGSKFGSGYGGQTVFEPRDVHKGDCARAMLYFITAYPQNYGSFWAESPYQEAAFRDWNKRFPPTAKSKARNNGVQQYQGNRNPFIDHPEFVDRINNFSGTATIITAPNLIASPMIVCHSKVGVGSEIGLFMTFANNGTAPLKVTSAVFSHPFYSLKDSLTDIEIGGIRKIFLNYKPTGPTTDSLSTLTLKYSDGVSIKTVVVSLTASFVSTGVEHERNSIPEGFSLFQNYPNPFNPSTMISYQVSALSDVTLKVFDVLGREIAELVNRKQEAGNYSVRFDAKNVSGGMYFYRLQSGNFAETKKMIFAK